MSKAGKKKAGKRLAKSHKPTRTRPPVWVKGFLASLRAKANITLACEEVRIDRRTVYNRRDAHPDFKADWEEALEEGADRLEAEAWRRAVDGVEKPVYQGGVLVGRVQEYSDHLMAILLKGHKPAKFRERVSNEITGKDGEALQVNIFNIPENGR